MSAAFWVALHLAGAVAGHVWGLWLWYWGAFALVEAAGLVWGFPYTATVRGFLAGSEGRTGFLRATLVGVWCVWLLVTWVLYSPLPGVVPGLVMVVFGLWIWAHFFGDRW